MHVDTEQDGGSLSKREAPVVLYVHLNSQARPCKNCDEIHDTLTRGCRPILFTDREWFDDLHRPTEFGDHREATDREVARGVPFNPVRTDG